MNEKKHLFLFEDLVLDYNSELTHQEIVLFLKNLKNREVIDFFILVPIEKRYSFYIYLDENKNGLSEIITKFQESKLFFRYWELI